MPSLKILVRCGIVVVIGYSLSLYAEPPEKFDTLSPKEPLKEPGEVIDQSERQAASALLDENKILVDHLRQVVLVSYEQEPIVSPEGAIRIDQGLCVPNRAELMQKLQGYICLPVTMCRLKAMTREIEGYYRTNGYPLVVAYLNPNQDIADGKVVVTVLIARLGCVKAEGARYFSNQKIAGQIRAKRGEYIKSDSMIADLAWINSHAFYSTNLVYERGARVGETDVVLKTEDRFPVRPYFGYENTGNPTVGVDRYFVGFNWGKAFWLDNHELNYQFTTAKHHTDWLAHSASYQIFLPWRNRFQVFGFYSRTEPDKDFTLHLTGRSWQISGRYLIPFVVWKIRHQFTAGYDFKRTNNFLSFDQNTVFNTLIDVCQFQLAYDGQAQDRLGLTTFGAQVVFSPGGMTSNNTNKKFQQERAGTRAHYVYSQLFLERSTHLFCGFSWYLKGVGQLSSAKLLPSEEMSIAGYRYVRGYYENEIIGDEGILFKNELRFPSLKNRKKSFGELQFLAFVDYGKVWDVDPNIKNRKSTSLVSVGPGLRYNFCDHLTARLDWAIRLKQPHTNSKKYRSQLCAGVVASF